MGKILWVDCETTGVDVLRCAIVQLAGIVEIEGQVKEEFEIEMRPWAGALIEEGALAANEMTREGLFECEMEEREGKRELEGKLGRYVSKFDKRDKFVAAGYNVRFDCDFLRAMWTRQNDPYFGSWFYWPVLDVSTLVAELVAGNGVRPKFDNFRLGTVCDAMGVELAKAHNAMEDIRATRRLYRRLKES